MKKQNLKRIIAMGLMSASILTVVPISASAEWKQDNTGWRYTEGNSWAIGWRLVSGNWYYFDKSGYMKTGWLQDGGKWYYLDSNGTMAKNTTINGYVLDSNGAWVQSAQNSSSNLKGNNSVNSSEIASSNNNNSKTLDSNTMLPNKDIEQAVSQAIKSKNQEAYLMGEVATEGHIILDQEEKDGVVKVYTLSSFGYFGFENGIFTKVSGSGATPTVMTFYKDADGEYSLIEYKEPIDGDECLESTKAMFSERLWDKVIYQANVIYPELAKMEETQAGEYLRKIGRTAKVSSDYVERDLPDIDVSASNKLFAEWGKDDFFLNDFPYWLGSVEKIENGERVIYETAQSKSNDGYDLITFKKMKADGTVIEQRKYKIVESEPVLQ